MSVPKSNECSDDEQRHNRIDGGCASDKQFKTVGPRRADRRFSKRVANKRTPVKGVPLR